MHQVFLPSFGEIVGIVVCDFGVDLQFLGPALRRDVGVGFPSLQAFGRDLLVVGSSDMDLAALSPVVVSLWVLGLCFDVDSPAPWSVDVGLLL